MPAIPVSPLALDPATGNLLPINANAVLFGSVLPLVVIELVVRIRAGRWNRRGGAPSVRGGGGGLAGAGVAGRARALARPHRPVAPPPLACS